jgi:hypothetical protein
MARYITFNYVNVITKIADKLRYTKSFFFWVGTFSLAGAIGDIYEL